jgi:RHS repeat-associated protein
MNNKFFSMRYIVLLFALLAVSNSIALGQCPDLVTEQTPAGIQCTPKVFNLSVLDEAEPAEGEEDGLQANLKWYKFVNGSYQFVTEGPNNNFQTPLISDNTNYKVEVFISGCSTYEFVFNLLVGSTAPAPSISTTGVTCNGDGMIEVNSPSGSYNWTYPPRGTPAIYDFVQISGSYNEKFEIFGATQAITVSVKQNVGGCPSNAAATELNIGTIPTVNAGANITACFNDGNIGLGGSPSGGAWSGTAVNGTNSTFNPSVAGLGTHTVRYDYTNAQGCSNYDTKTITVGPTFTVPLSTSVCSSHMAFDLRTILGNTTWSGTNVSGGRYFNAMEAVPGNSYILNYTITSDGCSYSDSHTIIVTTETPVDASLTADNQTFCGSSGSVLLTVSTGAPNVTGYIWTENGAIIEGATGNSYNASLTGSSRYFNVFALIGGSDCPSLPVSVAAIVQPSTPAPDVPTSVKACDGYAIVSISNPSGNYLWTYPQPQGDPSDFDFIVEAPDSYSIEIFGLRVPIDISVKKSGTCAMSQDIVVEYEPLPVVEAGTDLITCLEDGDITLSGVPAGGTWSFNGEDLANNVFSTQAAGFGDHIVKYTYTTEDGCTNFDTKTITVGPVFSIANSTTICGSNVAYDLGNILGNTSWTGEYVNDENYFNALLAGPGGHSVNYILTSNGCTYNGTHSISVTTDNAIEVEILADDKVLCGTGGTVTLSIEVPQSDPEPGEPGILGYAWLEDDVFVGTGESLDVELITTSRYFEVYAYLESATGCMSQPQSVSALLLPEEPAPIVPYQVNACDGYAVISISNPSGTYTWTYPAQTEEPLNYEDIQIAQNGHALQIIGLMEPSIDLMVSKNGPCNSAISPVTVSLQERVWEPTLNTDLVCSDGNTTTELSASPGVGGTTVHWYSSFDDAYWQRNSIGLSSNLNQTFNELRDYSYYITTFDENKECSSVPRLVTIAHRLKPDITNSGTVQSPICRNTPIDLDLSSSTTSVEYSISNSNVNSLVTVMGQLSESEGSYTVENPTGETQSVDLVVNSFDGFCYSDDLVIPIQVFSMFDSDNCDEKMNWSESHVYNEAGQIISSTKSYFDLSGRPLQSQAKNLIDPNVWVTAIVQDQEGREVLKTLPAPINRTDFGYEYYFMESNNNAAYKASDFDGDNIYSPAPVHPQNDGGLGWYYSTNNVDEPLTPTTNYPYTRTEYYETGEVKRVGSPGDAHHLGSGNNTVSGTFPVITELDEYISLREELFPETVGDLTGLANEAVQQVDMDANGQMAISISDKEGKSLMSALAGDNLLSISVPASTAIIEETGFERYFYVTDNETTFSWTSGNVQVEDVKRNDVYTNPSSLDRGLYRLIDGDYKPSYINKLTNVAYNFYDDAGRLRYAITPNGVRQHIEGVDINLIDKTEYIYNHQGWLIEINEPDAGTTHYKYRKDGSIRFSQNAEQNARNAFSYTNYDNAGRPIESGEVVSGLTFDAITTTHLDETNTSWEASPTYTVNDWVKTTYDFVDALPITELPNSFQNPEYLIGAVATTENENTQTWYSYDSEGKVIWIVQKFKHFYGADNPKYFTLDYRYDYFGNVLEVAFQRSIDGLNESLTAVDKSESQEAFHHIYTYDANNRLTDVLTTTNAITDTANTNYTGFRHVSYSYYRHGPLKRMELAPDMEYPLQGLDYTYTIEGWLKAVNHPNQANDPGQDGTATDFYKDAYGMTLEYYDNDYASASNNFAPVTGLSDYNDNYNGNIRATTWGRQNFIKPEPESLSKTIAAATTASAMVQARSVITLEPGFEVLAGNNFTAKVDPQAMTEVSQEIPGATAYTYDDKYQLKTAEFGENTSYTNPQFGNAYKVDNLTYDDNGNIQSLTRLDEEGTELHDFNYNYNSQTNERRDNQLEDIPGYGSYGYNEIGQMISQTIAGTPTHYQYDVTGKVTGVFENYNDQTKVYSDPILEFTYDDRGFRIKKTYYGTDQTFVTWYVRDASGNIISVYDNILTPENTPLQIELPIYGSGRIGVAFDRTGQYLKYNYEITDHLGNVRTVVSALKSMAVATMEEADNINSIEEAEFTNIVATRQTEATMNTTAGNPNYQNVAHLNATANKIIGPGRIIKVHEGDYVKMTVNARYIENATPTTFVTSLAAMVNSSFGFTPTGESMVAYNAIGDLFAAGSLVPDPSGLPKAYLNYLVFDLNHNPVAIDQNNLPWQNVSDAAATDHEPLGLEYIAPQDGYLYIYVANETMEDVDVYFDDLSIMHTGIDIVQTSDYYPGGLVMQQEKDENYRFGYQGQFSEYDSTIAKNQFKLRLYDPVTWRWNSTDPYRQYSSSYLGMGNNPISGIDPDGGFKREWMARFKAWLMPSYTNPIHFYHETEKEWVVMYTPKNGMTDYFKEGGPGLSISDFNGLGVEAGVDFHYRAGAIYANNQLWGYSGNLGSATILRFNPKFKLAIGSGFEGTSWGFSYIGQGGKVAISQGGLAEYGGDVKWGRTFEYDVPNGQLNQQTEYVGVGMPFVEVKYVHSSVHGDIFKSGFQEEATKTITSGPMNHAFTAGFNVQMTVK